MDKASSSSSLVRGQFISADDVSNINALAEKALQYKANPLADKNLGANKRIGLLFLNPSLRTRLSTQVAAQNLGMEAIVFNVDKEGWALEFEEGAIMSGSTVEHVKDAAPILGNYFDILCIRTFPSLKNREDDYSEMYISQFIKYAGVPVISLESATLHPLQSLTDVITIKETLNHSPLANGRKPKVVLTWAPHVKPLPQCVANSFSQWMTAWGDCDFTITHPEDYDLADKFTKGASITYNQDEALKDADYVYVKNWSTFEDYGKIYCNDPAWMLTEEKLKLTNNAKVMHCLPVRRNVELSDEILDSKNSIVTLEASNRVWAAQAVIAEILKNNKKQMDQLFVVKIGGNVIDNEADLSDFLKSFAAIEGAKILIHGGGKIATKIGDSLGIQSKYINGRRITDDETIDVVTMVYGGLVNKKIVAQLQKVGCNAIGLTGADGNIIPAVKRPVKEVNFGWVGDVDSNKVNIKTLENLLRAGLVPIFAPLTHDVDGHILNTNADTIASSLAIALSTSYSVRLIYCFEKKGILNNVNDENSVINLIDKQTYKQLLNEQKLFAGIIPKIDNAFAAIDAGVHEVLVGDAKDLLQNVTPKTNGTLFKA